MRSCARAVALATLAVIALAADPMIADAAAPGQDHPPAHSVLIITLPAAAWGDLHPGDTPNLERLLRTSALANLATRSVRSRTDAGTGYVAFGAGTRAVGDGEFDLRDVGDTIPGRCLAHPSGLSQERRPIVESGTSATNQVMRFRPAQISLINSRSKSPTPRKPQNSTTKAWLEAIWFTDKKHGWAVGETGTIVVTANGGETWNVQESGTRRGLFGLHFLSEKEGWAVGEDGLILKTNDGGENWLVQISNVTSHLLGVYAVTQKRVWIVGLNGFILSTTDGGNIWKRDLSSTSTPLRAVFFKGDDGWTVGRDGAILKYAGLGAGELKTVFGKD